MKLCILDAWGPEDAALVNSHWVAEKTVVALRCAFPDASLVILSGDSVDRPQVEAEVAAENDGFAYFGHGREHVLYRYTDDSNPVLPKEKRHPIPIIGIEQVSSLGPRWFHAFACLSGDALCMHAKNVGVAAHLGYGVKVTVEWDPAKLPDELRQLLEELVVVATIQLAAGERSRDTIRRHVRKVSNLLLEWMDIHEEEEACSSIHWIELTGLKMLANQLHQKLVLEGIAVLP